jgi:hypothetical protein
MAAVAASTAAVGISPAATAATQPPRPTLGPGGSQTAFGGVRVTAGGSGNDAWYVSEPVDPAPLSAPLVIIEHGYYEFSGYASLSALMRHVALKGNVVIYPRWQTNIAVPCPGPFNIKPCITSSVKGIRGALSYLRAHHHRVQPRLNEVSYFGFSFGGIITADMTSRYKALGLPKPRAIWLEDPHDGGFTGNNEPAVYRSLAGMPPAVKFICHVGASGVIAQPGFGNASCNSVFPKLGQIPVRNKSLVLTSNDAHGSPRLQATHGVCAGSTSGAGVDTFDWGFCWKDFDSLRACAYYGRDCEYTLGNNPQHRYIGTWSDGVPVIGLKIQQAAPISGTPVPPRQHKPQPEPNAPPVARLTGMRTVYSPKQRISLHGTASGDNGAQFVQIAIVHRVRSHCRQLTAEGALIPLAACARPNSFLWATGDTHWSVTLPQDLLPGSYRVYARAIDSFGRTQAGYPRGSRRAFTVT